MGVQNWIQATTRCRRRWNGYRDRGQTQFHSTGPRKTTHTQMLTVCVPCLNHFRLVEFTATQWLAWLLYRPRTTRRNPLRRPVRIHTTSSSQGPRKPLLLAGLLPTSCRTFEVRLAIAAKREKNTKSIVTKAKANVCSQVLRGTDFPMEATQPGESPTLSPAAGRLKEPKVERVTRFRCGSPARNPSAPDFWDGWFSLAFLRPEMATVGAQSISILFFRLCPPCWMAPIAAAAASSHVTRSIGCLFFFFYKRLT
ncbi:hypothetical protein BDP55DRAFT_362016 [Colletotrichum godetiae]|uniref:Uncharacterized protein n=1 Tax=Colletotrichum godetiae TaxID=1209918 RepID=A0AAJ0AA09_9PEZI|nr:uncharacterized protein BDP55DRAFT_362016 [Colletotrichum godetiae]KAK1659301.1 hypothetical protein BDP55DRAFT_362016 [Colletotrichum godetiae]